MRDDLRGIIDGSQIPISMLEKHYPPQRVVEGQCVESYICREGQRFLHFASLDYLSLATDPEVVAAGIQAMRIYGVGSLASPLVTGTIDIHLELRDALAEYMQAESAVVFSSGMLANIGSITAITNSQFRYLLGRPSKETRAIFTDELNHTSIEMACAIAESGGVKVYTFRHCNMESLAHLIEKHREDTNLIITDAVFSMEGDVALLADIIRVAASFQDEKHLIAVYADDAHGVGVLGENGRGACEACGVESEVVRMGVISKSFGTLGGYVVGEQWFVDYLRHSTTQMFSMGVPAAETAATIKALEIAKREPQRRQTVLTHAEYLRRNLTQMGFEVIGNTHIVPVIIGDEDEAVRVAASLEKRGILAPEIKFPAVPKQRARIRLSPVYRNTRQDLDHFLEVFSDVVKKK